MWKPFVVIAAMMIGIGISLCAVDRAVMQVNARGEPTDFAGDVIACKKCPEWYAEWQSRGYEYRCCNCGWTCRARKASGSADIEFNW